MQLEENLVLFSSPVVNGITFHFMNPPVHVLCFSSRGNTANGPTRPTAQHGLLVGQKVKKLVSGFIVTGFIVCFIRVGTSGKI